MTLPVLCAPRGETTTEHTESAKFFIITKTKNLCNLRAPRGETIAENAE